MSIVQKRTRSQQGFTLLEVMATLSVVAVVGSMATASMVGTRHSMQGDGAMRIVMSQLNTAREMAITQRRYMEVQFAGNNTMRIVRHEIVGNATTVVSTATLENNAIFALTPAVPDTPDAFGAGAAVSFGQAVTIMFGTDGTLIDANGSPVNGTVFLSIPTQSESTRAVTVLGATGRVRGYKWAAGANGTWVRV